ncbi:MAG: hypothetical protein R2716_04365 [Microthrixaceae bacterium]
MPTGETARVLLFTGRGVGKTTTEPRRLGELAARGPAWWSPRP